MFWPGGVSDEAVFVHSDGGRSGVEGRLSQCHGLVYEDIGNPNHLGNVRVEGNECLVGMFVTVRQTVVPDLNPLVSPVHPEGRLQRHRPCHLVNFQDVSQVYWEFYIHRKFILRSWVLKVLLLHDMYIVKLSHQGGSCSHHQSGECPHAFFYDSSENIIMQSFMGKSHHNCDNCINWDFPNLLLCTADAVCCGHCLLRS